MKSKSNNNFPMLPLEEPVHFIGAGGIGMSGLAELIISRGYSVSGSDVKSGQNTRRLEQLGAKIAYQHGAENLPSSGTVIVSSAIPKENPELIAAEAQGLKILHRSDLLLHFMEDSKRITVAGTHGKTTTTAMISYVFEQLGLDPTYAVGGCMNNTDRPVRTGQGAYFIAEVDESDGTIGKFQPDIAVITNVAPDHLDHYGSFENVEKAFQEHVKNIRPDGVAILGWDNPICRELAPFASEHIGYGFVIGSDVRAVAPKYGQGQSEFIAVVEKDQLKIKLPVIGRYNIENALATLAVARALEFDLARVSDCLSSFPGVARRLDLIHRTENLLIYDDYAHNPGKIAAVVQAVKQSFRDWKLRVAFQPHRYSRLATMYEEMTGAFKGADEVYLLPVFAAGETPIPHLTAEKITADISHFSDCPCNFFASFDELTNFVVKSNLDKTVLLTLGAGDVWQVARQLRDRLG